MITNSALISGTSPQKSIDRLAIERIVRELVSEKLATPPAGDNELVVSISARHCHLTDEHVETLFGPGSTLRPMKDLYQDRIGERSQGHAGSRVDIAPDQDQIAIG